MVRTVQASVLALLISANISSANTLSSVRWEAMKIVRQQVAESAKQARADGKDPKDLTITIMTDLSFLDVTVSAYYQPVSEKVADAIIDSSVATELTQLLFASNAAIDRKRADKSCLSKSCRSARNVTLPLSYRGFIHGTYSSSRPYAYAQN